jgi:hypothetical protein
MVVDLSRDTDVRFQPSPATSLVVSLTEETGWLARAGFRDRDRIIEVAGVASPDARSLHFAAMRAVAASSGELVIEREGRVIRVAMPVGDPPSLSDLGGTIAPSADGGAP